MRFARELARRYGFEEQQMDPIAEMLGVGPATLGDGTAATLGSLDFDTLMKHPEFSDAWAPVQAQLQAEGAKLDSLAVLDAQSKMADAFGQMTTQLGLSDPAQISDVAKAAGQFVMIGKTIAGALSTVQGLVNQATTGINDIKGAAQFTGGMIGTLVSTATALGAVSAGVGAAIVAVVGIVLDAASALFGDTAPKGTEICKGFFCTNAAFVVSGPSPGLPACVCVFAPTAVSGLAAIGPGSPGWRSFPHWSDPADRVWFGEPHDLGTGGSWIGTWKGADFEMPTWFRPIDAAFPVYPQLECDEAFPFGGAFGSKSNPLPYQLGIFNSYWLAAWRANAEYALNGLKPQPDSVVLLHALRTWNASHQPGKPYVLVPQAGTPIVGESWNAVAGLVNKSCPPQPFTTYMQMVAGDTLNASAPFDRTPDNKALIIHTGDPIDVPSAGNPPPAASSPAPAGLGTGAKVVLGASLLAGGGWFALGRPELSARAIEQAARNLFSGKRRRR